jgi:transposase InsO family protein
MDRYILSVIDVFSKYLNLVQVKTKSGQSITSAFRSLFRDDDSRRPVCLRTDKCKEFPNKHFQDILRDEGIQFQVCRNPDVKCAVVQRAHRKIPYRLYR